MDEKKKHMWGYKDTQFKINSKNETIKLSGDRYLICNYDMPYFIKLMKDELKLENIDLSDTRKQKKYTLKKPILNKKFLDLINDIDYSINDDDRLIHSHGQNTVLELNKILFSESNLNREVDCVIYPKNSDENLNFMQIINDLYSKIELLDKKMDNLYRYVRK